MFKGQLSSQVAFAIAMLFARVALIALGCFGLGAILSTVSLLIEPVSIAAEILLHGGLLVGGFSGIIISACVLLTLETASAEEHRAQTGIMMVCLLVISMIVAIFGWQSEEVQEMVRYALRTVNKHFLNF